MNTLCSHFWELSSHKRDGKYATIPYMGKNAVEQLADTLSRLIGPGQRYVSVSELEKASGVGKSTIARARRAETALKIDNLSDIAKAYKLEPWQMLVPGVDPQNPPRLFTADLESRSWPLTGLIDYERMARLDTSQLKYIADVLEPILSRCEDSEGESSKKHNSPAAGAA